MSDYIKREDVFALKGNCYDKDGHLLYAVGTGDIMRIPSADVVEVRHGHWDEDMECSICGCLAPVSHVTGEEYAYDYCPNCGAKMDGKEQENEVGRL